MDNYKIIWGLNIIFIKNLNPHLIVYLTIAENFISQFSSNFASQAETEVLSLCTRNFYFRKSSFS